MEYLRLIIGLGLPWLCGFAWLAWCLARFGGRCTLGRVGQAGYGFFLGYALLHAAVLAVSALTGAVSYGVVMGILAVLTVPAAALAHLHRPAGNAPRSPAESATVTGQYGSGEKVLLALLAAWIVVHLVFSAVELLTTPVYPWDAWDTWLYRAKAWFFAGQVTDLVSARDWVAAADPSVYAVTAHDYPLLASVVPFWAAVSHGAWSETLVNLPILLCGLALGMALWGQARALGLGPLPALALCYLLYATPLLGVHLSLGGYADIWLAGYAGLGFIAMLRGLTGGDRAQLLLGLGMVALGMLVKNEGVVWFYAAVLLLFLNRLRPRVSMAILAALAGLTAIALALDVGFVELPLVGGLGVAEGRLHLPLLGSFALEAHDIWRDYLTNLFAMGSWNLLWVLVLAGLVVALFPPYARAQRAAAIFILIFIATQVFIFGFTDQGLWVSRYTAVNRLPLQFLPALLFAVAMIAQPLLGAPQRAREAGDG